MKKNIAMRIAAFLFILTMISTCAFATTFAKYTTKGVATDTARVAKWGVKVSTIDAGANTLFQKEYTDTKNGLTVKADADVVAPGTKGSFGGFTITGKPEVSVEVTYSATLTLTGWKVENAEYCPIVIKVGEKEYKINGTALDNTTIETVAQLEDAVEAAIAAESQRYNVADYGDDANPIANTLSVSWSWAFEVEGTPEQKEEANNKDTALGDAATAKIQLDITCTVTQID